MTVLLMSDSTGSSTNDLVRYASNKGDVVFGLVPWFAGLLIIG